MDEKTLIEHAGKYLAALSTGINPIDNMPVPENSILKEEKIKRCLGYCTGVFKRITESENIEHGDYRIYFSDETKREPVVLKRAEFIIKKLSVGVNPLTGSKTDKNDTVNTERISKCLKYSSYVLSHTSLNKAPYLADENELEQIACCDDEISLSEFVKRLNSPIDGDHMDMIVPQMIITYLAGIKFLSTDDESCTPTKIGLQLGIIHKEESGEIYFNRTMQKLIVKNIEAITKKGGEN